MKYTITFKLKDAGWCFLRGEGTILVGGFSDCVFITMPMSKLRNSGGDVVHQVKRQWRCRPNGIMVRRRGEGEEVMTTMGM